MKEKYSIPLIKIEKLYKTDVLCESNDNASMNKEKSYSFFNYVEDFFSGNG